MESKQLSVTYAKICSDQDEPDFVYREDLYNIVAFSTEDNVSLSLPTLFFIPKKKNLPAIIRNSFNHVRCAYDTHKANTGINLEKWLQSNAEHIMQVNKYVQVVNREVPITTATIIPLTSLEPPKQGDE